MTNSVSPTTAPALQLATTGSADLRAALERDGFALVRGLVPPGVVLELREACARLVAQEGVRRRGGTAFAARNLLSLVPEVAAVLRSPAVRSVVETVLGKEGAPVKATLFDKTPEANWHVGWHQDVTIAVRERREAPGFLAWSTKAGVHHVQPPDEVLGRMVALRIHLDPCGADAGALRVIPGSHADGRLRSEEVAAWIARKTAVRCAAEAGDALVMRPLLLHASSPARRPTHRRVVHVEFAAGPLPHGLEWMSW